jgi:hypothetical protein
MPDKIVEWLRDKKSRPHRIAQSRDEMPTSAEGGETVLCHETATLYMWSDGGWAPVRDLLPPQGDQKRPPFVMGAGELCEIWAGERYLIAFQPIKTCIVTGVHMCRMDAERPLSTSIPSLDELQYWVSRHSWRDTPLGAARTPDPDVVVDPQITSQEEPKSEGQRL